MTGTGRQPTRPEIQQLPGTAEKQVLALVAEIAKLQNEVTTLRAALVLADARINANVEKTK